MGRGRAPASAAADRASPSLLAELRDLDVSLYDPPVAPPRVPVVIGHGASQRVTLGFADRRARARFLGRCTTEVAERCRGGASAACALAVARFDDGGDGGGGGNDQAGGRAHEATAAAATQAAAAPTAKRRPWWARMLLLPGPRDADGPAQRQESRPRARCEAEASRACQEHARAFCRAVVDEAAAAADE